MPYKANPKLAGSGMLACIPQADRCPMNCPDCFFQSGRSYLEPLSENLPNMPPLAQVLRRPTVVRVNDGNDSGIRPKKVMKACYSYPMKFYNTSISGSVEHLDAPTVLTVNPGPQTDEAPVLLDQIPPNLMFARVRTNTWNVLEVVDPAVSHYTAREVPVVLTFMAYYKTNVVHERLGDYRHLRDYNYHIRTQNPYWAITTKAWREVMCRYDTIPWVHSCGKVEGDMGTTLCRHCGNCLREYFATLERMEKDGT